MEAVAGGRGDYACGGRPGYVHHEPIRIGMQRFGALVRLMTDGDRIGRGSVAAPEELLAFCERHYDDLVGALSLYCADGEMAREFAQEALARVCRDWERVRVMGNPSGFAYRVGINVANSYFRRRLVERRVMRRQSRPGGGESYRDPDVGDRVAVRRAVADLPQRMRTALVLRFYADMSTAEIAQQMGMKDASVRTTVHRALEALADVLGREDLAVEEAADVH